MQSGEGQHNVMATTGWVHSEKLPLTQNEACRDHLALLHEPLGLEALAN